MIATYKPTKPDMKLNVREHPRQNAGVVNQIAEGEYEAEAVIKGWAKLEGGYADARFLTVADGERKEIKTEKAPSVEVAKPEHAQAEPDGYEEARANLKKMTNQQLYKLADESGIKVAKGSTRPS